MALLLKSKEALKGVEHVRAILKRAVISCFCKSFSIIDCMNMLYIVVDLSY